MHRQKNLHCPFDLDGDEDRHILVVVIRRDAFDGVEPAD